MFFSSFSVDENSGRMDPGENISCDGDSVAVLSGVHYHKNFSP